MTVSLLFSNKMAVKMVLFWISVVLSIISINADGELTVLTRPNSLQFSGNKEIRETELKEVFSAALGLSTEERSDWDGLYIGNPFKLPEAAVEMYVDGVANLGLFGDKATNYPLLVDEYEPDTFNYIRERIRSRFSIDNKLVNMKLSDLDNLKSYQDVFGPITVNKPSKDSLSFLKTSVEEDLQFLNELEVLKAVAAAVENMKPDFKVDFFNFRFTSLHPLADYHGPKSEETAEAKKLLNEAIIDLNIAFKKAYQGSVLFTVVSTDVAHTRRTARAAEDSRPGEAAKQEQANVESDPMDSADYPAIFNIILWFSVVIIFTLIAIVYAMIDMDPGRDSIIYRMTSTRMKKEN